MNESLESLGENWASIAAMAWIIYHLIRGYSKGFIRVFLTTISVVIAIFLAVRLYAPAFPYMAGFFKNAGIYSKEGRVILFAAFTIAIWLVLTIVIKNTDIVKRIPVIGTLNRMLGALLGIVFALIMLYVFMFIVKTLSDRPQLKTVTEQIEKSRLLNYIYNLTTHEL